MKYLIQIFLPTSILFSSLFCSPVSKPNIVFLLADDMSRDTWGVYGSVDCKTPNIDKLAKESTVFIRAYCSVAMCAPFRQELYSGKSPWRTGTLANHSRSKPETKSLPHFLAPLEYRSVLLGKSHVAPKSCYPFEYIKGGDKNLDLNDDYLKQSEKLFDECIKSKQAFCLFIASNDSHAPFTTGDPSQYNADKLTVPQYWIDTPELREELVKYYAEITNFDSLVGRVRQLLEQKGLWENTIFIVCSEQGTQLPFAKWTCYDNGLRTGIVWHMPGQKTPQTIDELIMTYDIAPTLLDLLGGKVPENDFDGQSFSKLLKGQTVKWRDEVYGAFTNCNIIENRERVYPIRVIRNKSFTLLYNANYKNYTSNLTITPSLNFLLSKADSKTGIASSWVSRIKEDSSLLQRVTMLHQRPEYEVYHLEKDPYELKNEIHNPEYQSVIKNLKDKLHQKLKSLGDADPIATETSLIHRKKK